MKLDTLIFAAHPDDAELGMGGTIIKLIRSGLTVGLIDLTRGELSTRGNIRLRKKESALAEKLMKLSLRENLEIPDGNISLSESNYNKVITALRLYQPKIIFAPYFNDRHPDHIDASILIKRSMFKSGLTKYKTSYEGKKQFAYRPSKLFYYMQTYTFTPSIVVDISDTFKDKMRAVKAFKSQLYSSDSKEPSTFISSKNFIKYIEARAQHYGFSIGKNYGEPFYCEEPIEYNFSELLSS
jgi:bacillithiol biosynthesis deacetylase BshB1